MSMGERTAVAKRGSGTGLRKGARESGGRLVTIHQLPPTVPDSLTLADLGSLPAVLNADQTCRMWRISKWQLYELVKKDAAPVAPLHLGRALRWSTVAVLRSIGVDP